VQSLCHQSGSIGDHRRAIRAHHHRSSASSGFIILIRAHQPHQGSSSSSRTRREAASSLAIRRNQRRNQRRNHVPGVKLPPRSLPIGAQPRASPPVGKWMGAVVSTGALSRVPLCNQT
jgi:hypothetical protein